MNILELGKLIQSFTIVTGTLGFLISALLVALRVWTSNN